MANSERGQQVWRKTTRSSANSACVEVASMQDGIGIRDSKNPKGPNLVFSQQDFGNFLKALKQQ